MAGASIHVEGLNDLRAQLRRLKDSELDAEQKAFFAGIAKEIIELALPNVPVLTGRLKASVRGTGTKATAIGRAGSKAVPYAAAVHWKYGPPFLTDAAAKVESVIADQADTHIAEMLDKTFGR